MCMVLDTYNEIGLLNRLRRILLVPLKLHFTHWVYFYFFITGQGKNSARNDVNAPKKINDYFKVCVK